MHELRQAARALSRQPRLALLAVLVLGLGIGLATAVHGIARALVLRGLPLPEAERLVAAGMRSPAEPGALLPASPPEARAWIEQQTTLEALAPFQAWFSYVRLPEGGTDVYVGAAVAPGLFEMLRVGPRLGRLPLAEDCALGRPVAVVSDAVWRDRFGRSPSILDRTVEINRRPHTVVGVMPPGFGFPYRQQVWTVLCPGDLPEEAAGGAAVFTVGRLRPGISAARATAELAAISARLAAAAGSTADRRAVDRAAGRDLEVRVEPYLHAVTDRRLVRALAAVGGGAGLLLAVACATVGLLLLLEGTRRHHLFALQAALGASPGRIRLGPLAAATLLSAGGALLALAVARGGTWVFDRLVSPSAYLRGYWVDVGMDGATLALAAAAALLAVPACGLLPALRAARTDPMIALRRGAGATPASAGWPGRLLVAGQVALSCLLLVGTAVTTRSALAAARHPYGFEPAGLTTAKLSLYAVPGIDDRTPEEQARLYLQVLERVRALPGVSGAAVSSALPAGVRTRRDFLLPGEEGAGAVRNVRWAGVSPGFAASLGVPLLAGRDLGAEDVAGRPPVAVVNRAFVRRHLGGVDGDLTRRRPAATPAGAAEDRTVGALIGLLAAGADRPVWTRIVGVIADSAVAAEGEGEGREAAYLPLSQVEGLGARFVHLLVRAAPGAVSADGVRREIRAVEPDLALWEAEPLTEVFGRRTWIARAFTGLFACFGLASTTLACAGLYAVVALGARRRRRELGIRAALGAGRRDLLRLVARQGAGELSAGLLVGLVLAGALAQRFAGVFTGQPADFLPLLLAAAGLLALVGTAALLLPAYRAGRSAPLAFLRNGREKG